MLTLTDLFAGAGGSSTGAIGVPGVEVRLAANHWAKAVEVHNANHPGADHLCADISQVDPRYIPATDILWASPGGSDARSIGEALATFCASGNHHGLVTPVGGTWTDKSLDVTREPFWTQTTNDGNALVTPYYGASESAKSTADPIGTLTTVDRYALVHRHNSGSAEMLTPVSEVMRTLTTTGHQSVLTPGDIEAAEAQVDDCLFRMLEPHEVAAGMAFPGDYVWEGTRRERVRMAGNAVTPPAARDLVSAVAETLN